MNDSAGSNHVYPVDFEYALIHEAKFIISAQQALKIMIEYQDHNPALTGMMQVDRTSITNELTTKLTKAIEADIQNGAINAFYEKFANMTSEQLTAIINSVGILIHANEKKTHLADLQKRQDETRKFLQMQNISNNCDKPLKHRY